MTKARKKEKRCQAARVKSDAKGYDVRRGDGLCDDRWCRLMYDFDSDGIMMVPGSRRPACHLAPCHLDSFFSDSAAHSCSCRSKHAPSYDTCSMRRHTTARAETLVQLKTRSHTLHSQLKSTTTDTGLSSLFQFIRKTQ